MSVAQEERERMANMQFTFGLLQRYEIRQALRTYGRRVKHS